MYSFDFVPKKELISSVSLNVCVHNSKKTYWNKQIVFLDFTETLTQPELKLNIQFYIIIYHVGPYRSCKAANFIFVFTLLAAYILQSMVLNVERKLCQDHSEVEHPVASSYNAYSPASLPIC